MIGVPFIFLAKADGYTTSAYPVVTHSLHAKIMLLGAFLKSLQVNTIVEPLDCISEVLMHLLIIC